MMKISTLILFLSLANSILCQESKYLLLDKSKDSIVNLGKIKYYKINKNLFDINRFNEIDTICQNWISNIRFTSVNELLKDGQKLFLKVSNEKNLILESYNQIFEKIYVLEKISKEKFKKTRVWWIDY